MTLKIALNGIKSRFKDYLILFAGLIISAAIFYMFQSIASNKAFLKTNTLIKIQSTIYTSYIGSALLGLIILIYVFYANSFLLTMRQRSYAMYMMLGAKSRKIAQLIFLETLFIGFISVAIGEILGIGLSQVTSQWIINSLDLKIQHFSSFNLKAMFVTTFFFLIIFAIAAIFNAGKLVSRPIINLMKQPETPRRISRSKILWFVEIFFGIALLAIGYWIMGKLKKPPFEGVINIIYGLIIIFIAIVFGTYFSFDALFLGIVQLLRNSDQYKFKNLGQLSFRLRDFTRMLSAITIMFSCALGAITVGPTFNDQVLNDINNVTYYDLLLHDPTAKDIKEASKLKLKSKTVYHYKAAGKKVFWNAEEFDKNPYISLLNEKNVEEKVTGKDILKNNSLPFLVTFQRYVPDQFTDFKTVGAKGLAYKNLNAEEHNIHLYKLKNFKKDYRQLKNLVDRDDKRSSQGSLDKQVVNFVQKYDIYQDGNSEFAGFEFIGLFLGIAFLAMLVSCLMFRVLSSATKDTMRYLRLHQIGTQKSLLRSSIFSETGCLFFFPALLGVIHVLFGLRMFKAAKLLSNPYMNLMAPFSIFLILYLMYYLATVFLYQDIVVPKENQSRIS